jgi:hypothetical protein
MSRLCMLGVVLVVLTAASAVGVPNAPPAKIPKELLQERVAAARSVWEQTKVRVQNQGGAPTELSGWSERWLDAELALCDKASERVIALREYLDRTREVERLAVALARTGQGRQADAAAATYYRVDAEIRLFKEGVEPHPAKGQK